MSEIKKINRWNEADWIGAIPFFLMHMSWVLVFWAGVSSVAVWVCLATCYLRVFAVTAGYHRYFSHRAFKTNRVFQFILAFLGASSGQMGPLWWANHHRHHHRHADTEKDLHSPVRFGFWWAHMGWVLSRKNYEDREMEAVRDLKKFPELVWLERYCLVPFFLLFLAMLWLGSFLEAHYPELGTSAFQMVVWGFFVSTILLYHLTFSINSLAHLFGSRRFETPDTSRNNAVLGLLAMGEGWHNNHHRYPSVTRQGLLWWEVDLTYYILVLLSKLGVVSNLIKPPAEVYVKKGRA